MPSLGRPRSPSCGPAGRAVGPRDARVGASARRPSQPFGAEPARRASIDTSTRRASSARTAALHALPLGGSRPPHISLAGHLLRGVALRETYFSGGGPPPRASLPGGSRQSPCCGCAWAWGCARCARARTGWARSAPRNARSAAAPWLSAGSAGSSLRFRCVATVTTAASGTSPGTLPSERRWPDTRQRSGSADGSY